MAEDLSHGIKALGLAPEVEGEGRWWRFMGIWSRNRKEWYLTHMAGMFQGITSVGLHE